MTEKEEILAWDKGLIVFDTSALLDLYLYSKSTRQKLLESYFEKLQNKLWIPKQVEFEFNANKANIIQKIRSKYDFLLKPVSQRKDSNALGKIGQNISNIISQFKQIEEATKDNSKHPYFDSESISSFNAKIKAFKGSFEEFSKTLNKEADETIKELKGSEDITNLENMIKALFKVGKGLSYEDKIKIIEEGEFRYRNGIPPGYEDAKEKEGFRQYGDLFIWKEILKKAKENETPIIFVINDLKKDWWDNTDKKNRKPREELVHELKDHSDQDLYMYDASKFIHNAGIFLKMTVSDIILKEIEEVIEDNQRFIGSGSDLMRYVNKLYTFELDTGNRIRGVLLPDFFAGKDRFFFIPQDKMKLYKELQNNGNEDAAKELRHYIDYRRIIGVHTY